MLLKRKILFFLYTTLFRHTPDKWRPYALFFPTIRNWLVTRFVDKAGTDIRVKSNADISMFISIGDRSELGSGSLIYGGVHIGSDVLMGPDVKIITRNHLFEDPTIRISDQGTVFQAVTIDDDVWIGANVVILPGVNVGKGSVIAAGAIVTKDIMPFTIVGGVPAKTIDKRGK